MNKKAIIFAILALAVLSLSSCGSKKNSCTKVNTQEQAQQMQQNVDVACIEVE